MAINYVLELSELTYVSPSKTLVELEISEQLKYLFICFTSNNSYNNKSMTNGYKNLRAKYRLAQR